MQPPALRNQTKRSRRSSRSGPLYPATGVLLDSFDHTQIAALGNRARRAVVELHAVPPHRLDPMRIHDTGTMGPHKTRRHLPFDGRQPFAIGERSSIVNDDAPFFRSIQANDAIFRNETRAATGFIEADSSAPFTFRSRYADHRVINRILAGHRRTLDTWRHIVSVRYMQVHDARSFRRKPPYKCGRLTELYLGSRRVGNEGAIRCHHHAGGTNRADTPMLVDQLYPVTIFGLNERAHLRGAASVLTRQWADPRHIFSHRQHHGIYVAAHVMVDQHLTGTSHHRAIRRPAVSRAPSNISAINRHIRPFPLHTCKRINKQNRAFRTLSFRPRTFCIENLVCVLR